jgi:hypothetical protein
VAVTFGAGLGQSWTVPGGNISVLDMLVWGSGGNGGGQDLGYGGSGGGAGGFANTGPIAVVPGTVYTVNVDAGNGGAQSSILDPASTAIATATSGTAASGLSIGVGGTGTVGLTSQTGGSGASAPSVPVTDVGGGGGAAGYGADGTTPTTASGGAGGGTAEYLSYGVGGDGGDGGAIGDAGLPGVGPGGGGGGAGQDSNTGGAGADGLVVVVYALPYSNAGISLSHRDDVSPGVGILNYLPGATFPTLISDDDIGAIIRDEWWIVSGINNVPVQITEYLYEDEGDWQ